MNFQNIHVGRDMDPFTLPGSEFTFEPSKHKEPSKGIVHEQHYLFTKNEEKQNLLAILADIEDEITKLGNDKLGERLEDLRRQVETVLEKEEEKLENLRGEIQSLKTEVRNLNAKNEALEKKLAVAQATWVWEAHLARFVIDSSEPVYEFGRFRQMNKYLKNKKRKQNYWLAIKRKLSISWTNEHWEVVNDVRRERNGIAHPDLIDLEIVESVLRNMTLSEKFRERIQNMLDILKMTASLMKFGRLAKFYERNELLFPTQHGRGMDARALKEIISWDRNFEQINGLQNIEHEEAKRYLAKYVDNRAMINHYFFIVDSIKDGNSKRLGKLAWEIEKHFDSQRMSNVERQVLNELKKLLPNPNDESNVADLTIAKLHIPDFLPSRLWKYGVKIVEQYFEETR